ncbi:MAG: hypothetical protein DMG67_03035 [Acidobacteria bacterium]|nr:MAG: hypothetical protein DMG67_03035 [Acidobacteriota bacterium]
MLPVGVIGDDEPGRLLLQQFRHRHIPTSGIQKVKGHTTVTKTRILAGMTHTSRQQVVRVDREPQEDLDRHVVGELILAARKYAGASDALLVSDYGYGAATPEILTAVRSRGALNGMPVTLDSRYRLLEYTGITAATPNEPEVEEALSVKIGGDSARLMNAGKSLLQRMKMESLVITRGRHGMVRLRPGDRRDRRGRHRGRGFHRSPGYGRRCRRSGTTGQRSRRPGGNEARHSHHFPPGIIARTGIGSLKTCSSRARIYGLRKSPFLVIPARSGETSIVTRDVHVAHHVWLQSPYLGHNEFLKYFQGMIRA